MSVSIEVFSSARLSTSTVILKPRIPLARIYLISLTAYLERKLNMSKNPSREILHFTQDEDAAREIENYWTEERMENAKPIELPQLSQQEMEKLRQESGVQDNSTEESQRIESSDAEAKTAADAAGQPSKANVKKRPYWNGGKFFGTDNNGNNFTGSAEFVGCNKVVMTAAHCVVNPTTCQQYTNLLFRRAYKKGGGQKVSITSVMLYKSWCNGAQGNFVWDYAFLATSTTSGAGWLGLQLGVPYSSWTSIGYPSNYGGGKEMYEVVGNMGTNSGGIVQMLNNPMTFGASGGAWIGALSSNPGNSNYAIGVNSFINSSTPGSIYSPLFTAQTSALYQNAANYAGC